jgi:hypothetical protein
VGALLPTPLIHAECPAGVNNAAMKAPARGNHSAAMGPSPDFNRRRDGIATRSTRAKVADSRLQQLPLRVTRSFHIVQYGEGRGARGVTGCKRPVFLTKKTLACWGPSTPYITEPPVQPTQSPLSGRTSFRAR